MTVNNGFVPSSHGPIRFDREIGAFVVPVLPIISDKSGRMSPSEMAAALDLAKQVGKNVTVTMLPEAPSWR